MNDAEAGGRNDPEIMNVYRQAALHLARLLREQGRVEEAQSVSLHLEAPRRIDSK